MEKSNYGDPSMDFPQYFRCPISMELMQDPVTISTGVSYERKNIEKWFQRYKKKTCPATMQPIESFDITPNHNLKRLIDAWCSSRDNHNHPSVPASGSPQQDELASLMGSIDSSPFKVSAVRKLRSVLESGEQMMGYFKRSGGVEVLVRIVVQILAENSDFVAFRACEEALGVLHKVPLSEEDEKIFELVMDPDFLKSMAVILQRGSAEARVCAISTLLKMSKADHNEWNHLAENQGIDFFKSLLETLSDEICPTACSSALKLLIQILENSKKARLKAIEAGAVCTLVELLPESNRSRCEKIMHLIKILCECADGRLGFIEHGLGIAAVAKKMMNVSNVATKIGVKILWLISNFHPTERVLEEMLVCGAVKKLVALLHFDSGAGPRSSTKERVLKILKMHAGTWRRYPCFPSELRNYLGLGNDSC